MLNRLFSIVPAAILMFVSAPLAHAGWQTATRLSDGVDNGQTCKAPQVVGSIDGGFHATWITNANLIRYRHFNGSNPAPITTASSFSFNIQMAEALNGDVHIAWENWPGDTPEVGWTYSTDYSTFAPFQELSASSGQAKFPFLAPWGTEPSANMLMSYWRSSSHDLYYNTFDGISWSGEGPIGYSSPDEYSIHGMARSPVDGSIYRSYNSNGYVALTRFNGTSWEAPVNLYYEGFFARQKVAVNDAGQVMVAWDMSFDTGYIYSVIYTPGQGAGARQNVVYSPDTWNIDLTSIPGSNDFYLAYTDNGSSRTVGKKYTSSSNSWGSTELVSNGIANEFQVNPAVGADPNGSGAVYALMEYWGDGYGNDTNPQIYYNIRTPDPTPAYAALLLNKSLPAVAQVNEEIPITLTYMNIGTGAWDTTNTKIGTSDPRDRASAFYNPADWPAANRVTTADNAAASGQVATFTFIAKAPATPGLYTEKFELLQEGTSWFEAGGDDLTWEIEVKDTNVAPTLSSLTLSDDMLVSNDSTTYTITMQADDSNGGTDVRVMRCLFNYQGDNAGQYRGYLSWGKTPGDITEWGGTTAWQTSTVTGGSGYWGFRTNSYGGTSYITPVSATESNSGNSRTVQFTFKVKPLWQTQGPLTNNDISGMCADDYVILNWQNFDLNFDIYPLNVEMPDFDHDLDVDMEDFGQYQSCLTGANVAQNDPDCALAKLSTNDNDVDVEDTAIFRGCLSGPGVTADNGCLP